jgi:hypothetical protein
MLNAKRYAPMNARDKMPLEITPIFFKLQRYDESKLAAQATSVASPVPAAAGVEGQSTPPDATPPDPGNAPQQQPAGTAPNPQ